MRSQKYRLKNYKEWRVFPNALYFLTVSIDGGKMFTLWLVTILRTFFDCAKTSSGLTIPASRIPAENLHWRRPASNIHPIIRPMVPIHPMFASIAVALRPSHNDVGRNVAFSARNRTRLLSIISFALRWSCCDHCKFAVPSTTYSHRPRRFAWV